MPLFHIVQIFAWTGQEVADSEVGESSCSCTESDDNDSVSSQISSSEWDSESMGSVSEEWLAKVSLGSQESTPDHADMDNKDFVCDGSESTMSTDFNVKQDGSYYGSSLDSAWQSSECDSADEESLESMSEEELGKVSPGS